MELPAVIGKYGRPTDKHTDMRGPIKKSIGQILFILFTFLN